MVNGVVDFGLGACDFGFEDRDTVPKLFDGEGIKILPGKRHQRIVGALGQDVVQVHARIVDRNPESVNEADCELCRPSTAPPAPQRTLGSISPTAPPALLARDGCQRPQA